MERGLFYGAGALVGFNFDFAERFVVSVGGGASYFKEESAGPAHRLGPLHGPVFHG